MWAQKMLRSCGFSVLMRIWLNQFQTKRSQFWKLNQLSEPGRFSKSILERMGSWPYLFKSRVISPVLLPFFNLSCAILLIQLENWDILFAVDCVSGETLIGISVTAHVVLTVLSSAVSGHRRLNIFFEKLFHFSHGSTDLEAGHILSTEHKTPVLPKGM